MLLNWFVAVGFVSFFGFVSVWNIISVQWRDDHLSSCSGKGFESFGISKPNVAVPEPSINILFLLAVLCLISVKYKKKSFKY